MTSSIELHFLFYTSVSSIAFTAFLLHCSVVLGVSVSFSSWIFGQITFNSPPLKLHKGPYSKFQRNGFNSQKVEYGFGPQSREIVFPKQGQQYGCEQRVS